MEVQLDPSLIVKSQTNLVVSIHALVIMNTSDHCNRAKYIEPRLNRVFGLLLGKQEGKTLELVNSVEIAYKMDDGKIMFDLAFL